jgi:hypothetical protein
MAIKYTIIFHSKALQNLPILGFLVWKSTIWQPWCVADLHFWHKKFTSADAGLMNRLGTQETFLIQKQWRCKFINMIHVLEWETLLTIGLFENGSDEHKNNVSDAILLSFMCKLTFFYVKEKLFFFNVRAYVWSQDHAHMYIWTWLNETYSVASQVLVHTTDKAETQI